MLTHEDLSISKGKTSTSTLKNKGTNLTQSKECDTRSKAVLKSTHLTSSWCWEMSEYFVSSRQLTKLEVAELDKMKLSVALVRERTIPTERPPPVGEVSANFCV